MYVQYGTYFCYDPRPPNFELAQHHFHVRWDQPRGVLAYGEFQLFVCARPTLACRIGLGEKLPKTAGFKRNGQAEAKLRRVEKRSLVLFQMMSTCIEICLPAESLPSIHPSAVSHPASFGR
jgi:hypothetical protein